MKDGRDFRYLIIDVLMKLRLFNSFARVFHNIWKLEINSPVENKNIITVVHLRNKTPSEVSQK